MSTARETFAMRLSLGVAVLMLVGKTSAAWMTRSDAILSDASESLVHIVATAFAAFSLWYASQPADRQHPYGHGKMAYFSAGFEGALIGIAGITILAMSARSLWLGHAIQNLGLGLAITGSLGLVNLALGLFLVKTGEQNHSLVLISNGKHVLSDMWTSLAVVIGVALTWATDLLWLDPVIAAGAGLHILIEGFKLLRQSFDGLMERASEEDTKTLLKGLQQAVTDGLITDFHQLHHRNVEQNTWIEVHLLMKADLTLTHAHDRANEVEARLAALFPENTLHITTHLEPDQHQQAHPEGHLNHQDPLLESLPEDSTS